MSVKCLIPRGTGFYADFADIEVTETEISVTCRNISTLDPDRQFLVKYGFTENEAIAGLSLECHRVLYKEGKFYWQ
jgi:hypothetical protein